MEEDESDLETNRVPPIHASEEQKDPQTFTQARHETSLQNYPKAFQLYVDYIDQLSDPDLLPQIDQENFTEIVLKLGSYCEELNMDEEALKCYIQLINFFPKNVLVLNALGSYLFKKGECEIARKYLSKAAAEGFLPSEKNLLHVLWDLIPRWHFRMLNDDLRNKLYRSAINAAVEEGFTHVYDIGTGCGLLSLIAGRNKNVTVVGFEENKTLYNIAREILEKNQITNITLYQSNSTDFIEPPSPCDLIITEIFDSGLLGENCLKSINHAVKTFARGPFKIIPNAAKMFVTGIESQQLHKKYSTLFNEICLKADLEPYDSEYLNQSEVAYLTNTQDFLNIDFSCLENLANWRKEIKLKCLQEGVIHALAVWFDLNLHEGIVISTHPKSNSNKCWEQAIFYFPQPLTVKADEEIEVVMEIIDNKLHLHQNEMKYFKASKEIVSFLNDKELVNAIIRLEGRFNQCKILDCNVFPLFGYLMAKKGATVYHVYKEISDLKFYKYLAQKENLKMVFIHENTLADYVIYLSSLDIVFVDLIKSDGSWNGVNLSKDITSNSRVIPKKVFLKAKLISSESLDFWNKVDDKKALSFGIGEFINEFSGNEHPGLYNLKHETLSSIAVCDLSDFEVKSFSLDVEVVQSGNLNGIYYWFAFQYSDDESTVFETLNSSYYGKTCSYFCNPRLVNDGDKLKIVVEREDSHLKLYCD